MRGCKKCLLAAFCLSRRDFDPTSCLFKCKECGGTFVFYLIDLGTVYEGKIRRTPPCIAAYPEFGLRHICSDCHLSTLLEETEHVDPI